MDTAEKPLTLKTLALPQLVSTIAACIQEGDLEGHICALILSPITDYVSNSVEHSLQSLRVAAEPNLQRPQDVATRGVRIALGLARPDGFSEAAKRELAREPLPPAACARDDERILLGVAAGVGRAATELASQVALLVEEGGGEARHALSRVWAPSLASGEVEFTPESSAIAIDILRREGALRGLDATSSMWIASRVLSSTARLTDQQIAETAQTLDVATRSVVVDLASGALPGAIDAALIVDAFSRTPTARLVQQDVVQSVLAVIDAFPAAAEILATRQQGRPPLEVRCEADVQDLFRALVVHRIPDLTPEDPSPKVAGQGSRLDFTSRASRLGFEIKFVRNKAHARTVREELLIDEATYHRHPSVETVVVFVYDPDCFIALPNRAAFEADLSQPVTISHRTVTYITRVR